MKWLMPRRFPSIRYRHLVCITPRLSKLSQVNLIKIGFDSGGFQNDRTSTLSVRKGQSMAFRAAADWYSTDEDFQTSPAFDGQPYQGTPPRRYRALCAGWRKNKLCVIGGWAFASRNCATSSFHKPKLWRAGG